MFHHLPPKPGKPKKACLEIPNYKSQITNKRGAQGAYFFDVLGEKHVSLGKIIHYNVINSTPKTIITEPVKRSLMPVSLKINAPKITHNMALVRLIEIT